MMMPLLSPLGSDQWDHKRRKLLMVPLEIVEHSLNLRVIKSFKLYENSILQLKVHLNLTRLIGD
jgi:hypothetical protein